MIDPWTWMEQLRQRLQTAFPGRVWFLGLQGSFGRGEAREGSDIDPVVILDRLTAADAETYRALLDTLPHRELACGFLAGRRELEHWPPADFFSLYHDTTPLEGSLDSLAHRAGREAGQEAVHMGAANLYHACLHNLLHARKESTVRGLYKQAAFVLQAAYFVRTGTFVRRQEELLPLLEPAGQEILSHSLRLRAGEPVEVGPLSQLLLEWAGPLFEL